MIDALQITQLQNELVERWHRQAVEQTEEGFLGLVSRQCGFNFLLWHEEDIARSPTVSDAEITRVKRNIDRFNQQRNDAIEQLDDAITNHLGSLGIAPLHEARLNSETLGSVIDRLSILALRIYHLREQTERSDVTPQHVQAVQAKLAVALAQHVDLTQCLAELAEDIFAGRKRHKTYRQMKMYNDPTLNPQIYQASPALRMA